ncbi:MAG: c-type cytochrome [Candidatus Binatia bacterium]
MKRAGIVQSTLILIAVLGSAASARQGPGQGPMGLRGSGTMQQISGMMQQMGGRMYGGGMMGGRMMGRKPSSSQAAGTAASTYSKFCASCHGAKGKGDGPAAVALNPKPKDFTDSKVMAHMSDAMLFKTIKKGGQATGHSPLMPAWGGTLTDQQISELVGYIRSLSKK